MYEPFSLLIYFLDSLLSGLYLQKLLPRSSHKIPALLLWITAYFSAQLFRDGFSGVSSPTNALYRILAALALFSLVSPILYPGDRSIRLFAAASFTAGCEIVRFISSAAFSALSGWVLQRISEKPEYTAGAATAKAVTLLSTTGDICLLFAILLQFTLLALYLYVIAEQLFPFPSPLRMLEILFLLSPSVTVLCISATLQLLVITFERGMSTVVYETIPVTQLWIPLISLLLLGIIVSSLYLFRKMMQGHEEEKKRLLFENQITHIQNEVAEIQDIYADIRSLRHDLRGHLANIAALVREDAVHALPEYIDKMEATLDRLDFPARTGNPITDIVLHRKEQEALRKQIPLQIDFSYPAGLNIDAYDMGIILNNALSNAIESGEHSGGTEGISLRSYRKGRLFFLEVENDFTGDVAWNEKTGLPHSSKRDGQLHGMGLSSIRRCAQKYNGGIDINIITAQEKKMFQLTVMLCARDFTPEKP